MPFAAEKQSYNTTRTLQGSDDMAKKYLTIEEAAEILGVDPSDLSRLREKGEIRAFADRGNWKFRQDDVDELARKRQTDSDPDVPLFKPPAAPKAPVDDDLAGTFVFEEPVTPGSSDSSINLGSEPDEIIGNQPTIVRKGGLDDLMGSDSDVRLVFDDSLMPDNSDDVLSDSDHSDSDVRLINFDKPKDDGSDSDVKLVADKASVKTPKNKGEASDSDVTLIGQNKEDAFTLDLDESDGSFVFGGESSGIALGGFAEEDDADSGITLDLAGDSGIALEAGDSGISLDPGGSGISLEPDDSSLVLAGDSGISLGGPSDSGIALEGLMSGDSGVGKKKPKGKKPAQDLGGTMPEMPMMSAPDDELGNTQMEIPMLGGQDSEFEFTASPLDDDSHTDFAMLGEDDAPAARKGGAKKGKSQDEDDDLFDTSTTVEFSADDDEFDSSADVFADDSDDMEVADDVIGEDDEIAEDVFGAADEDFDEELQSGQSSSDFAVPSMAGPRVSAPIQAEWGGATFGMLLVSSAVMLLTSFMMYDVVRTMWGNNEPNAGTEMILSSFRGMFG